MSANSKLWIQVIGVFVLAALVIGVILAPSVYGLYLAFHVSILLGIIALIVEPTPLALAVLAWCGHPEVSGKIATWLHLPF